ncbi:hypothetical protein RAA17_12175 [Komagataeibacter rhaeticus]|nr:hypothetical protein [Komagataeibacter rhaeticus]
MRVRDCTQYDDIPNPFSSEYNGAGEYIPLDKRRPSVRTNMCATVVDESASLVFGEMHWPSLTAEDETVPGVMAALDRECALPAVMIEVCHSRFGRVIGPAGRDGGPQAVHFDT